ncbi:helix-turn-helix domain-containing protein [Flavobacterium sp.]|uniref:helix-turn-helix domain-containing protein n=1 Tax=Flavobacterium sp. TaxID=239 RepID=UPI00391D5E2C
MLKAIIELKACIEAPRTMVPDEEFLDSHRMEKLLKCSPSKLYRLRKNGQIPCTMVGRQYLYPKNFFIQEVLNSIIKHEDQSKRFDDQ